MDFTLRQLEAFVSVARLGSFTRAAAFLHLSQPALSVQIRHLEQALGVRLLDRTTRSVALTQVGREFVPILEHAVGDINAVAVNARELAAKRRGTVTVAALPSISSRLIPATIAIFKAQHPSITVRLRDAVAHRVVVLVKAGEVDFGIASSTRTDPEITVTPLIRERMGVVFPSGHPIEQKNRITLEDLTHFPLILMDPESSVRPVVDRAFESIGHSAVPAYEATYTSTAIGLVRAGLGIAILPSTTGLEGGQLAGVTVRSIDHEGLTRRIGVVQKTGRSLSPAAEHFVRVIRDVCKMLRF